MMIRNIVHPPHIQHLNQIPPQAATVHHMTTMSQQNQAPPQHMNLSSVQQQHIMHPQANYHQNRSGGQHNHHTQQRLAYTQNRATFQNGNHNMHNNHGGNANVVHVSANIPQTQSQSLNTIGKHKHETNLNMQHQSNQSRYKQIEPPPMNSQQQPLSTMQMAIAGDTMLTTIDGDKDTSKLMSNVKHECDSDTENAGKTATPPAPMPIKTKTPMCLVNELVRANQLKHQYRVINESGPSHEKTYTVVLELGDERYTAQSKTIKGAQHSAAAFALEKTQYTHPVNRASRNTRMPREKFGSSNTVTPTVQLNALAMKRGMPTNYSYQYPKSYNEQSLHGKSGGIISNLRLNSLNNPRIRLRDKQNNNRPTQFIHRTTEDDPYFVTVDIGDKKYIGTGLTLQSAKHDAASKALLALKDEPPKIVHSPLGNNQLDLTEKLGDANGISINGNSVDCIKSAISIVQEIAQKRNLPIRFMVENETGPAHMKHFVIKCSVGEIETTGDGNSKKIAKKHAAENMLNELNKLPPLPSPSSDSASTGRRNLRALKRNLLINNRQQVQTVNPRRKVSNVVNDVMLGCQPLQDDCEIANPVATLMRIQQLSKQAEPIYTVVEEHGQGRRKEFVMEVKCDGSLARGSGSSKKIAKQIAAKEMLDQMGYISVGGGVMGAASTADSSIHISPNTNENMRKTTFSEARMISENLIGIRQIPGILIKPSPEKSKHSTQTSLNHTKTAAIAKELLDGGKPTTAETIRNQSSQATPNTLRMDDKTITSDLSPSKIEQNNNSINESKNSTHGIRAADQLLYLADLLQFEVQFDDFPKGNHSDYLTLASLNTEPPQMFHGYGNSLEASKNQAALSALKALSELGLDNVNKPRDQPTKSILKNGKAN